MWRSRWEKLAYEVIGTIIVFGIPTGFMVLVLWIASLCGMKGDI